MLLRHGIIKASAAAHAPGKGADARAMRLPRRRGARAARVAACVAIAEPSEDAKVLDSEHP